jgi:hypothetical protein
MIQGILALALGAFLFADSPQAELAKGIKQVEEGDYNGAIVTLDSVASALRLSKDPAQSKDLAQAYLYLGIAYVGLGHETSAKAKFREALMQSKEDMTLSPVQFPPKVIELFEVAKQEGRPKTAAAPAPPPKKGGSKKGLLIGGAVLVVGGAGAAVAMGGGSDEPSDSRQVATVTGTTEQYNCFPGDIRVVPTASGTLDATLTWTDASAVAALDISLYDNAGAEAGKSNPASNTEARLSARVTNQIYTLYVCQGGYANRVNFTLTYRYP